MIKKNRPHQIPEVQGESLLPLDRFWLETVQNATKESVRSLEEAAKQLITITSLSQGIYFAAVSFIDLKKALVQFSEAQQWGITAALLIPLLFWLASLYFAILVFKPKTYQANLNSPDLARETYQEIVAYKHKQLGSAHIALILGFIALLINIVAFWRL